MTSHTSRNMENCERSRPMCSQSCQANSSRNMTVITWSDTAADISCSLNPALPKQSILTQTVNLCSAACVFVILEDRCVMSNSGEVNKADKTSAVELYHLPRLKRDIMRPLRAALAAQCHCLQWVKWIGTICREMNERRPQVTERGQRGGRTSGWDEGEVVWANQWDEKLVSILLDLSPPMSTRSVSLKKRRCPVCPESSRINLILSSTAHLMKDIMVWVGWTTVSRPFWWIDCKSFIRL